MSKIAILSAGPGLPEIVRKYGHSSNWIPNMLSKHNLKFINREVYNNDLGDINEADGWIITGSKYSVYEDRSWINNLKLYVSKLIDNNKYILGICFGHQLLAHCLGAEVKKNPLGWELGSYKICLSKAGLKHLLFSGLSNYELVYESHQDIVCNMPDNLIPLAYTDKSNQSFSYSSNIFGVQFHPEFSWEVTKLLMDLRIKKGVTVDSKKLKLASNSYKILDNFVSLIKDN